MKNFTSDGLEFPILDFGPEPGQVVVLLHGFPADAHSWSATAKALSAAGLRVLVPFQRGYAPTARPKRVSAYRLKELGRDIVELLDAAGVERAHVVGHDWGGGVGWFLADRYPSRIASLTVFSTPHPRALARTLFTSKQILLSWYLLFFQVPVLPEWVITRGRGRVARAWLRKLGLDEKAAAIYATKFTEDRKLLTGALNWYRALPLDAAYGLKAGVVRVPTLYIWGAADRTVGEKAARMTARWVTGPYDFQALEGVTHWIPEQAPERAAELIQEHVEGVGGV